MTRGMTVVALAIVAAFLVVFIAVDRPAALTAPVAVAQHSGHDQMSGMPMQDMQKMHEKMMADMKAEQAKLDELVAKMNSSTGDAKVGVMAQLLTELVQKHGAMTQRMGMMHEHMMKGK